MKKAKLLFNLINSYQNFLLVGHIKPDGDTIGAVSAFFEVLKEMDKKVDIVFKDSIPELFSFILEGISVKDDFFTGDYEAIILMDCGDLKRSGFDKRLLEAKKHKKIMINIDHHPKNDIWKHTKYNFSDPSLSSTCEILYKFFVDQQIDISSKCATALLSGIYYDTGGFIHSNTSDEVLNIISSLLSKGAHLNKISNSVNQNRSSAMLKLWGIAIKNIIEKKDLGIIISHLSLDEIKSCGAKEEEISGLVNLLATALEAKVSILIYETEDGKIRGSVRTEKDDIDASKLAKFLGGGGHKKAAGFVIEGCIKKKSDGLIEII